MFSAMASSLSIAPPSHVHHRLSNPSSTFHSSPVILSVHFYWNASSLHHRLSTLKSAASVGDDSLKKPLVSQGKRTLEERGYVYEEEEEEEEDGAEDEERWVDWEDQILEDTVPLVGFVRMILHSGQYDSGDRLSPEHEKTIIEKLLPFHPESEKKIGCGIDYITIGYHPDFERSRCLFIVRQDGELVDFSYWKCIKGLIRKNYPLYADSFILRHFRKRSRNL